MAARGEEEKLEVAKAALETVAKAVEGSRRSASRVAGMASLVEVGKKEEAEAEKAMAAMVGKLGKRRKQAEWTKGATAAAAQEEVARQHLMEALGTMLAAVAGANLGWMAAAEGRLAEVAAKRKERTAAVMAQREVTATEAAGAAAETKAMMEETREALVAESELRVVLEKTRWKGMQ